MPRGSSKPPTDVTGRQAEALAEQFRAEQEEAAAHMSVITAQREAQKSEVVDITGPNANRPVPQAPGVEMVEGPVEVSRPSVKIRVNTDLEDVTIGAGNNYTFLRGTTYQVPAAIADHLEEKGYVYH